MKKLLYFVCLAILLTACSEKEGNDEGCIGVIDFIGPPSFQLKFVDSDANNLIENEYYNANDISASLNGQLYDNQIVNFDNVFVQNVVYLSSGTGNEGKNTWVLRLSENETDTLEYSLVYTEVRQDGFCGTNSSVATATYNGSPIDLEASINEGSYNYSLIINKTPE